MVSVAASSKDSKRRSLVTYSERDDFQIISNCCSYRNVRSKSNNNPIHASESTQPFKVTDEIKDRINALVDANRTNAATVIGIIDPN
jgi:hypothetical protein